MRRFLIPLVFVALLTVAAVVPVAANSGDAAPTHSGKVCGANLKRSPYVCWFLSTGSL